MNQLWAKEKVLFDYLLFFSVFVPPLVIRFGFRAWQLSRSVHRYKERGARVF
jgi:hypothetical protein